MIEKLYRGVSVELDTMNNGKLVILGQATEADVTWGQEGVSFGAGYVYGVSRVNAIKAHHVDSKMKKLGFLSTTRDYSVAVRFATHNNSVPGYIYTLDVCKFEAHGIMCHELPDSIYPDEQEVSISCEFGNVIPDSVVDKKEPIFPT
jgi:hypothetical protein